MPYYHEARRALRLARDGLGTINFAAAARLEEEFGETLTVNQMRLLEDLRKAFNHSDIIESDLLVTEDICRNIQGQLDANMAMPWADTMLLEAEKKRLSHHRLWKHELR